ncbi:MAG: carboxypeptidase-like regulatory domain-containing protein [Minisyncoccia bacterium]
MVRHLRGFSLIDVIVGVALLLVTFLALFGVLRASLTLSTITKAKAAGVELGNSQMEYLRGFSYEALGTVGGIPGGAIPQMATTTVDGVSYGVRTFIEYHDDPADGEGLLDTNAITTDYKTGKVTITYTIYGLTKSLVLVSNFAPSGIEAATDGGTLSLHVVDKSNADVTDASVRIVNSAISPAVDFTTFTNASGLVLIGGAATSSEYQIYVSRAGYSSAQTYARTGQNVNPTPGYLTVVKNQTTSATFTIDELATFTLASWSPATTATFTDTFDSVANLASQTDTTVTGGELVLATEALSGSARSIPISPSYLAGWGILSATYVAPAGTSIVVRIDDTSGTPLPDSALAGNSVGFSAFPISLTGIATSSYPGLSLEASLASDAITTTPSLLDWSLSYTTGPAPLPNTAFTLTGAKSIGTDSNDLNIYKTVLADTTGAGAAKSESLEFDTYTLTLDSANLIESCFPGPYTLAPAGATSTSLLVGDPTTNALSVLITDSIGSAIHGAKVVLTKAGYAATVSTSVCGTSYFNGLSAGTYSATVSASGYPTTSFPAIPVAGNTGTTTLTLP